MNITASRENEYVGTAPSMNGKTILPATITTIRHNSGAPKWTDYYQAQIKTRESINYIPESSLARDYLTERALLDSILQHSVTIEG